MQFINAPYTVISFMAHNRLKEALLCAIDVLNCSTISDPEYSISKSDWDLPKSTPRPYIDILRKDLEPALAEAFKTFGFSKHQIHNVWFQQYTQHNGHPWHNHSGCHFTCIYYLELPETAPKTQFINPLDNSSIFQVEVEEGDILVIPSFIKHRSPPVETNVRKTIISFNSSVIEDNTVVKNEY